MTDITQKLAEALAPFANAVYNDNGDMTVNYTAVDYGDFTKAYFTLAEFKTLPSHDKPENDYADMRSPQVETAPAIIANMSALNDALEKENTRLRAALAQSELPCVYCTLSQEDWAKCKSGFPGCARADDAMGCPELGAALRVKELEAEVEKWKAKAIAERDEKLDSAIRVNALNVHLINKVEAAEARGIERAAEWHDEMSEFYMKNRKYERRAYDLTGEHRDYAAAIRALLPKKG